MLRPTELPVVGQTCFGLERFRVLPREDSNELISGGCSGGRKRLHYSAIGLLKKAVAPV